MLFRLCRRHCFRIDGWLSRALNVIAVNTVANTRHAEEIIAKAATIALLAVAILAIARFTLIRRVYPDLLRTHLLHFFPFIIFALHTITRVLTHLTALQTNAVHLSAVSILARTAQLCVDRTALRYGSVSLRALQFRIVTLLIASAMVCVIVRRLQKMTPIFRGLRVCLFERSVVRMWRRVTDRNREDTWNYLQI